jgi:hypothetical protein
MEIENGKIRSTMLGTEDHGIFTCFIDIDFDGSGQGFGGYGLDSWSKKHDRRIGTAYGLEFIKHILDVVGVEKWEDLVGKYIRVKHDMTKIESIGHITKNKWFDPRNDLAEFEG